MYPRTVTFEKFTIGVLRKFSKFSATVYRI
jgi:hypothetical protein